VRKTTRLIVAVALVIAVLPGPLAWCAPKAPKQPAKKKPAKKRPPAYATMDEARKAGPDFDIMGEYVGTVAGGKKIGVQVIALGGGHFQAVFLPGGLPGAGWDEKTKILCQGKLADGKVVFEPAKGSRRYLGGGADQFSATRQFPPKTQKPYTATIEGGKLTGKTDTGEAIAAEKVQRASSTICAKPPTGAIVLLAFAPPKPPSLDAWTNNKWLAKKEGCMQIGPRAKGNTTKQRFTGSWRLHIEFRSPFQPHARGQGRGNSGVFPPGGREIQVLDSFGLAGLSNECGGIYKSHNSKVNMCLPPLSWQTYDVTYYAGGDGAKPWYKVVHNGVTIHAKVDLGKPSGKLNMQDHGNPVSYRNIWIVPAK